jgi:hypothetical protein
MKSFVFEVERPGTVGIEFDVEQATVAGTLVLGSKGDTVLAPETANSRALALVGVPPSVMVTTSDRSTFDAVPYHSV